MARSLGLPDWSARAEPRCFEQFSALIGAMAGEIYQDGQLVTFANPLDAVQHRVCLLTENRKEEGLVLAMPVRVNVTLD